MSYFDLKHTRVYRAVILDKILPASAVHKAVVIGFILLAVLLALLVLNPKILGPGRTFGLFLVVSSLTFGFWVYSLFFKTYLDKAESTIEQAENLADYLDYQCVEIFDTFLHKGHQDLSALLVEIAKIPGSHFVLYRMGVAPGKFQESLEQNLKIPRPEPLTGFLQLFLDDAVEERRKLGRNWPLTWRDLFITLCVHSEFLRQFIFGLHLEKKDIRILVDWQEEVEQSKEFKKKFWLRENLMRTRGIGKDWAAGYTVNLDKYAIDVSQLLARRGFAAHLYGRKDETEAIEQILARAGENNVVLVGEEGVGKKTIAYALSKRIASGQTLPQLAHKRVLELDLGALLAGAKSEHEVEARMKTVLNEAVRAGNVVLLISDIHSLFTSSGEAGTVNATEILLPYLSSSLFQVIGLATYGGYHETIAKHSSLVRAFEKVEVHEPPKDDVFKILRGVVPQIEDHSQVLILYQAMRAAVELTDRYIKNMPFPEKAIDVLQEAAVYAQTKARSSVVSSEHVEEVVHRKTEIPVGKIALAEKEVLLNLENVLHRRVIDQEEAIAAIANAMRRARSGIASEKKPIGSFLFLGPTGVGKTETAKALAAVYFGSEQRMIRFDMSEYQQADSINRLIGHGEESGLMTTEVMENPFSLVLLDEVEKAHPNILNLFLQVLDDGRLTDALGRTVDFTNTIIIATSNAGAELIRQSIQQFRETNLKERLLDYLQKQGIFRPEFLNRFDALVVYKPLTPEQTERVVELLLADLNRRLKEKDITLKSSPALMKRIAEAGYDPEFGARPLRRVIQDRVENLIAKKLLGGEIKRGDVVEVRPEEI